jgi:hypothetical protein
MLDGEHLNGLLEGDMKLKRRFAAVITACAAILTAGAVELAGTPEVSASHYRANQLSWHQATGNTIEFHFSGSWRCSYFFSAPCSAQPGDTFTEPFIDTGDGNGINPIMTVTSVDIANDVVNAEAHESYTYASAGPFTARVASCCRLSGSGGHINNPDGSVSFETIVDLNATTASPVSLVAPIVDCPIDALCSFTVPAADPDNQPISWRMATPAEAGDGFFNQPPGATINAGNGLYSWNTTGATLAPSGSTFYSTQVIVENVVNGNVISKTPVDFFIRLGSGSTNQQPVFEPPTPADGAVITGTVGTPLTFSVRASDPDAGDAVTPGILGLPMGATFTPTAGNPATAAFNWTPTATGDFLITLTAADQQGLGAVPRGVILRIGAGGNPPPVVDAGPGVTGAENESVTLDGTATDTEPLTTTWTATPGAGVDPGAQCVFADPAAVDTTVACDDDGIWTLTLTANDGTNPAVSDTTQLTVTDAVAEPHKVTGKGYLKVVGSRPFFDFLAESDSAGATTGRMLFRAKGQTAVFRGSVISSLSINGVTASLTGTGKWNGQPGYTFDATVADNRPPLKRPPDHMSITIKNPAGVVVYTVSAAVKSGAITVWF